eukprot:752727-Prymnesium_polylepis.1
MYIQGREEHGQPSCGVPSADWTLGHRPCGPARRRASLLRKAGRQRRQRRWQTRRGREPPADCDREPTALC